MDRGEMWIEDLDWIEDDEALDDALGGVLVPVDGEGVSGREFAAVSRLLARLRNVPNLGSSA